MFSRWYFPYLPSSLFDEGGDNDDEDVCTALLTNGKSPSAESTDVADGKGRMEMADELSTMKNGSSAKNRGENLSTKAEKSLITLLTAD